MPGLKLVCKRILQVKGAFEARHRASSLRVVRISFFKYRLSHHVPPQSAGRNSLMPLESRMQAVMLRRIWTPHGWNGDSNSHTPTMHQNQTEKILQQLFETCETGTGHDACSFFCSHLVLLLVLHLYMSMQTCVK